MKKLSVIIVVFTFISCNLLDEVDLDSIAWHATSVINLESSLLGESTDITVNVAWRWLLEQPSGEGIIIERSIGDASNYIPIDTVEIETLMTYPDRDTLLQPNTTVFYRLGFLDEGSIDYFETLEVSLPQEQHFYSPTQDTIGNETLSVVFARLADFDDCEVSIYRGHATDPESLMNLTNPEFVDTLSYPDTSLVIPDSVYADNDIYTIRLLSLNEVEVSPGGLTNVSTTLSAGFRAFVKNP